MSYSSGEGAGHSRYYKVESAMGRRRRYEDETGSQHPKKIRLPFFVSFSGHRQIHSGIGASTCHYRLLLTSCQDLVHCGSRLGSPAPAGLLMRPASSRCADPDHEISWWPVVIDTIITSFITI